MRGRPTAVAIAASAMIAAAMTPARAATSHVHVENFAFAPSETTITPGDTVTWDNHDMVTHTVTADDDSFDSGLLGEGDSFGFTFAQTGSFAYHCEIHAGMRGIVSVLSEEPDLVVTALSGADGTPGQKNVIVDVKNQGLETAGAFDVLVGYVYKGSFRSIGTIAFTPILGNSFQTRSIAWKTLGKIGVFTLRAEADAGETISEANESNNSRDASTNVIVPVIPGIDLLEP